MPQLRAPDGSIVSVPDEQASQLIAGGYQPVSIGEAGAVTAERERPTSGVLAPLGAAASSFLSGATVGLSDVAFKDLFDREGYERLAADREAHPYISGAGQLAGALVGGPTPAGYLSKAGGAIAEGGGVAAKLGAGAFEGSVYGAGAYLADTALGDRELSAEGLIGAMGSGMEFGVAGGAAALGLERGTIAARRLFSRAAGTDKAVQAAEQAWAAKYQSTIEAHDAAADIARAKLAEASLARQQAQLAQQRAAADVAETRIPQPAPVPEAAPPGGAGPAAGAEVSPAPGIPGPTGAPVPAPAPAVSPDVEIAGLLRDRAMAAMSPDQLAAWDAANGPRLQAAMEARGPWRYSSAAASAPDAHAALAALVRPAETAASRSAALSDAAEKELAAALAEHDAARASLDDILQRIEAPGVQVPGGTSPLRSPAVPVGEFSEPGVGGMKSPDELARAAAGEPSGPRFGSGTPPGEQATGAGGPRALRGRPTPELAAEQPTTAVGKRPAAGTSAEPVEKSGGPLEIRRIKEGRKVTFEARMPDGSTRTLTDRGEVSDLVNAELPSEFQHGSTLETHRDLAIEHGLPKDAASIRDNALYVVKPSELADHGILGNEIRPDAIELARTTVREGTRIPPVEIDIAPNGQMWVVDGNHRLQVNAELGDRPVAVKFRASEAPKVVGGPGRNPNIDIGERLREAMGARVTAPATDTLTGQIRGTAAKLAAGENLVEMGAPARASYLADKQARTTAAAEHFRGKALAEREARAAAVAQGETQNPFHEPARTWREFQAERMGAYMKSEGGHAGAMKRLGKEWRALQGEHPLAVKQLEAEHVAALDRAETAATPGERAAAAREAQAIERHLTAVGARPGAVEDIAAVAEHVTKYEKASARLTEALGADAPPAAQDAAKALRDAEAAVERKSVARTTRAIEDHAANKPPAMSAADWNEQQMAAGRPDALAPPPKVPGSAESPRMAAAKAGKLRADAGVARARVAETEAKLGAQAAERQAAETRAAAEAARPAPPPAGEPSKLGAALTTLGVAAEIGIPGLPHPKDIPLIGPLLDVYLKYRALKAASGRFVGRVAATGDTRAAALVAKTKDRIAAAVDRTLGLAEQLAPKARTPLVATAVVLGRRVFDDGQPDARKGASEAEMAAVRIREISTAVTRPDLVTAMVRQQLGGVTDPDLIDAAVSTLQQQFQYLAGTMPKAPAPNPYTKTQWVPSAGDTANLARRLAVLHDPQSAIDNPTPAGADALNHFYPKLAAFAQQRLAERAADMKNPAEYHQLVKASLVFQIPMHASLQPENAVILRGAFSGSVSGSSAGPTAPAGAPPQPSIAGPTNLSNLYQPQGARAQR